MKLFCFLGISFLAFQTSFAYNKTLYGEQKVGKPYQIGKKTYKPQEYAHLQEEGYISWYGPGFHAKRTANGAIFDKNTFTAAHKTLQLPSVIEITNLENGRKLIAVVNDRGPFSESQNRILDVSEKIAKDLGFINAGVIRARVRLLPNETKHLIAGKKVKLGLVNNSERRIIEEPQKLIQEMKASETAQEVTENLPSFRTAFDFGYLSGTYIQVGAFKNRDNTMKVLKKLQGEGIDSAKIRTERNAKNENIDIVRVGPVEKGLEENLLTKIKSLGYNNASVLILK
jgi:rare lipoprotein A